MVCIRPATAADLVAMQMTNMWCLPENYALRYYLYHYMSWPQLLQVTENHKGEVVGYVLAKMEEQAENDPTPPHGHITSLAVRRTYRKCGIATRMMRQAHSRMKDCFDSHYCSLHVRYSNRAAFHLYSQTLGYTIAAVESKYYADGEDAYNMRCVLKTKKKKRAKPKTGDAQSLGEVVNKVSELRVAENNNNAPSSSSRGRPPDSH